MQINPENNLSISQMRTRRNCMRDRLLDANQGAGARTDYSSLTVTRDLWATGSYGSC